jgi:hypothetical protein
LLRTLLRRLSGLNSRAWKVQHCKGVGHMGEWMRFIAIVLAALATLNCAEAAFRGGGYGYDDGYDPGYGPGPGYGAPPYGGGRYGGLSYGPGFTGEEINGSSSFLSCGCAMRIKLGRESEDVACDNYSRLHQNMILNPGSTIPGMAPASNHLGGYSLLYKRNNLPSS